MYRLMLYKDVLDTIGDVAYDVGVRYQISINQVYYLDSFIFVIRDKDRIVPLYIFEYVEKMVFDGLDGLQQ